MNLFVVFIFSVCFGGKCDKFVQKQVKYLGEELKDVQGCKKGCFWNNTFNDDGTARCEKCSAIKDKFLCNYRSKNCQWSKKGKCKSTSCPQIAKDIDPTNVDRFQTCMKEADNLLRLCKQQCDLSSIDCFSCDEGSFSSFDRSGYCAAATNYCPDQCTYLFNYGNYSGLSGIYNGRPEEDNRTTPGDGDFNGPHSFPSDNGSHSSLPSVPFPPSAPSTFQPRCDNFGTKADVFDVDDFKTHNKHYCYYHFGIHPKFRKSKLSKEAAQSRRAECHMLYGCFYSATKDLCDPWSIWAFVVTVVLVTLFIAAVVVGLCIVRKRKR